MLRSRALLLTVAVPLMVFAAPVPESVSHAKRFRNTFGASYSPAGCSFQFDGTTLTAKFPKGLTGDYEDLTGGMRTERRAAGDFEMTVEMRTTAPLYPPKTTGNERCDLGGGLIVWEPDAKTPGAIAKTEKSQPKAVSVCRYYDFLGEPEYAGPRLWEWGQVVNFPGRRYQRDDMGGDPTETIHLRMTRRGQVITSAISNDGEIWKDLKRVEIDLTDVVSVGVWAFEGSNHQYDVIFEKFTLKPAK